MTPLPLLIVLVAALVALLPVWRLRVAAWRPRWLLAAWLGYAMSVFLVLGLPGPMRFLVPILVLAYIAPFVAGPERLARVLGSRPAPPRPIIDVTPRPPVGIPGPPDADADEEDGR
jgi:hypothetical protein